jgi:hypothetical protein
MASQAAESDDSSKKGGNGYDWFTNHFGDTGAGDHHRPGIGALQMVVLPLGGDKGRISHVAAGG